MLSLQNGEADAMSLDGGYAYIAGQCGLVPVMAENYGECAECLLLCFLLSGLWRGEPQPSLSQIPVYLAVIKCVLLRPSVVGFSFSLFFALWGACHPALKYGLILLMNAQP